MPPRPYISSTVGVARRQQQRDFEERRSDGRCPVLSVTAIDDGAVIIQDALRWDA
jgi:hypothetical protein